MAVAVVTAALQARKGPKETKGLRASQANEDWRESKDFKACKVCKA